MRKTTFFFTTATIVGLFFSILADAQQYKLRQSSGMAGMKYESTIYVKGQRKRTEGGMKIMGLNEIVTIEQCDLQRTVKLNDKKKLYFIQPFTNDEVVINDDDKPTPATKITPKPDTAKKVVKKGGVITTWYSITDTGERKKMYGLTARHVWTFQKMKPSADACYMKDSLVIKTDGWYIDLPQFNCLEKIKNRPAAPNQKIELDCKDRYIMHRSGKGKLGFPLEETTTIIMGNQGPQKSEFATTIETLELSTAKLDSMLFEIPPGYTEAKSEEELQEKLSVAEMIKEAKENYKNNNVTDPTAAPDAGKIKIGVYEPKGGENLEAPVLQQRLVNSLSTGNVIAVAVASEEEAKKFNCTYSLTTDFQKIKSASKVGGLLKAIKNTDPNAVSSYNIDATLTLASLTGGTAPPQQKVNGKYEGKMDAAVGKALDDGAREVLNAVR